nr:hypothetical protein CFP56_64784 [Quercus suber]
MLAAPLCFAADTLAFDARSLRDLEYYTECVRPSSIASIPVDRFKASAICESVGCCSVVQEAILVMLSIYLLALLLEVIQLSWTAPNADSPMLTQAKWPMELYDDGDTAKAVAVPTWHKTYLWPETREPSYVDVLTATEAYFNWVATLYDPVSRTMQSSAVPRGQRKTLMTLERTRAPRWYSRAAAYVNGVGPPNEKGEIDIPFCAEDGAAFGYERREGNGLGPDTPVNQCESTISDGNCTSLIARWR